MTSGSDVTLAELTEGLRAFVYDRGWESWHTPRNLALALAGEVGELCQLLRWRRDEQSLVDVREMLGDEIADIGIFLLYLADTLDFDFAALVQSKLANNDTRFDSSESPT